MPEAKPKFVRWLTPAELVDHPTDLQYPEYRRGWVDVTAADPEPDAWTLIGEHGSYLKCRHSNRTRCRNAPVAIMWRSGRGGSLVRWAYCELHMYGRIVEEGRILAPWFLERSDFPGGAS